MQQRALFVALCLAAAVAVAAGAFVPFFASIELKQTTRPVERRLLGQNFQWVSNGDELVLGNYFENDEVRQTLFPRLSRTDLVIWAKVVFNPGVKSKLSELGLTVGRYPGGANTDVFEWRKSVSLLAPEREAACPRWPCVPCMCPELATCPVWVAESSHVLHWDLDLPTRSFSMCIVDSRLLCALIPRRSRRKWLSAASASTATILRARRKCSSACRNFWSSW